MEPLIVDLPPAEPGRPLVRPEAPSPAPAAPTPPPVATARPQPAPAPPRDPKPVPPAPTPAPVAPVPAPPTPVPEPPPPPEVARVPEPLPPPAAAPPPDEVSPPRPVTPPTPTPPAVAARPPEPAESGPPVRPDVPPSSPEEERDGPKAGPFGDQTFSLLRPRIEAPPLPRPSLPGGGGTRSEGEGAGEAGRERDGQASIPLNTPDPRYADYFLEIKKRIEAHLVYPQEAARQNQSGQLMLEFVVKKDGTVAIVELRRSSGVGILDRYSLNTIRLSSPFPPIPERMGMERVVISASFTYVLDHGYRLFNLR
jgi:TonB family protein